MVIFSIHYLFIVFFCEIIVIFVTGYLIKFTVLQITYIPRYQFGIVYVRGITMSVIRRLWNYLRNNGNTEFGKMRGC